MTGVRSYLAGTGASGSLLAAAAIAFISVTAFVAFDGVPFGSGEDDGATVSIDGPNAAAATAVAAAGPPAAIAPAPAAPAAAAPAAAGPGAPGPAPAPGAAPGPGDPPAGAPGAPGTATATDVAGGGDGAAAPANPVDDLVTGLDQTLQDATGTNPGLSNVTKPITSAVDGIIQNATGNNLGGHVNEAQSGVNDLLAP